MRSIMFAFAAILATAFAVSAEPLVIATGKQGGGYAKAAENWSVRLSQGSTAIETELQYMNGSKEIAAALCGGRASLGLAQVDAMYAYQKEGCKLVPVGVYGTEVAVLLFPPKSRLSKLSQLNETSRVGVDTIGSGTELFWSTITGIEKEHGKGDNWAKAEKVTQPVAMAHALGTAGNIDAQVLVRKPNSPDITNLLELGWTVGYFWDKDIDDQKFVGAPLYESQKLTFEATRRQKNYVYAVNSFYLAAPQLERDQTLLMNVANAAAN